MGRLKRSPNDSGQIGIQAYWQNYVENASASGAVCRKIPGRRKMCTFQENVRKKSKLLSSIHLSGLGVVLNNHTTMSKITGGGGLGVAMCQCLWGSVSPQSCRRPGVAYQLTGVVTAVGCCCRYDTILQPPHPAEKSVSCQQRREQSKQIKTFTSLPGEHNVFNLCLTSKLNGWLNWGRNHK